MPTLPHQSDVDADHRDSRGGDGEASSIWERANLVNLRTRWGPMTVGDFQPVSGIPILTKCANGLRAVHFAIALVAPMLAMQSYARDTTDGLAREARDAVESASTPSAPSSELDGRSLLDSTLPPKPLQYNLKFGVAHDSNQAGTKTTNLPYELTYTTEHSSQSIDYWSFKLSSDGVERIAAPGQSTLTGVADQKISVLRPLGSAQVLGSLTYKLPTHGDVGSTSSSLGGKLSFSQTIGKWTGIIIGGLTRSEDRPPGASRYSLLGYAEVDYCLAKDRTLLVDLTRVRTGGTVGGTDLALEYDFPVTAIASKAFLSITRGITPTAYHTAVELDFSHKF